MANIVPPIGSKGLFLLRIPFVANPSIIYHVGAIRSFEELISRGIDPVKLVYTPAGLTDASYAEDAAAGALILTLLSDTLKPLYVPTTYVDSYPNMGVVPHSWLVATVDCGILPDTYDTTRLTQAIQRAVSEDIGVGSTVFIARAPTTDAITQDQYVQNLAARNAAIKNRTTDFVLLQTARSDIANLTQSNQALVDLVQQLQARIAELEGSAPGT